MDGGTSPAPRPYRRPSVGFRPTLCVRAPLRELADALGRLAESADGPRATYDRYGRNIHSERLAAQEPGWADGRAEGVVDEARPGERLVHRLSPLLPYGGLVFTALLGRVNAEGFLGFWPTVIGADRACSRTVSPRHDGRSSAGARASTAPRPSSTTGSAEPGDPGGAGAPAPVTRTVQCRVTPSAERPVTPFGFRIRPTIRPQIPYRDGSLA
ncbi:hypothetical protein GCM10010232_34430 [Streptomyces amakusaensis]